MHGMPGLGNKKGAFVCWHNLLSPGKPKYHRPCALSLLCSEWEEVGHTQVEHQQTKDPFYTNQLFEIEINRCFTKLVKFEHISTPRLKPLRALHLEPINLVVFQEFIVSNLGRGFVLRCFQHLSFPNIATRRFSWYQSRYTRGSFISVLSY